MTHVFNFRKFLAFFTAPRSPLDAALRELALGRAEEALVMFDALARGEIAVEQRALIANKRGVAFVMLGRREEAKAAFDSALQFVSAFAPALVNLGNLEFEAGDVGRAVEYYERATRADEYSASAFRHLALAYRRMGRTGESLRAFTRARRLEGRGAPKQRT